MYIRSEVKNVSVNFACLFVCISAQDCLEGICPKQVTLKTVKSLSNSNLELTKKLLYKRKTQLEKKYKNLCQGIEPSEWKQHWSKLGMTLPEDPTFPCLSHRETTSHRMPQVATKAALCYLLFSLPSSSVLFHGYCHQECHQLSHSQQVLPFQVSWSYPWSSRFP